MLHDLRLALRSLLRAPGLFAAQHDHEGALSISLARDSASTRVLAFGMTVTREIAHSGNRIVTVDQAFNFTLDPKKVRIDLGDIRVEQ